MGGLIFITWFFLAILFLVSFFIAVNCGFSKGIKTAEIFSRSFAFTLVYVLTTFVSFLFLIVIIVGAEPRREGQERVFSEMVIGFAVVFVYGLINWGLCCLVAGKIVTPKMLLGFNKNKTTSLFDT